MPYTDFASSEARFAMLQRSNPTRAHELGALADSDIAARWRYYEQLAGVERAAPSHIGDAIPTAAETETGAQP
ncbi:MAG: hypothetical protein HY826_14910 [Actinobacteria bacterium]|nr:hypothetical protein [Actinomycetota bacterium]